MPRTDLPAAQQVNASTPIAALNLAAVDGTNGNQWTYKGDQLLVVRNGGASSITATIKSATTVDGLVVPDRTVTIAASATAVILEAQVARQLANGKIYIDWSAAASVTAGLIDPA
ncbi:hypothetical protein [Kitasatospora sp. NPDC057738]|uniref:hypothetical protein n=1 Tax=Kitasatospora sp. NPDC057738 TaxID=3346233 RepID=UPI003673F20C